MATEITELCTAISAIWLACSAQQVAEEIHDVGSSQQHSTQSRISRLNESTHDTDRCRQLTLKDAIIMTL